MQIVIDIPDKVKEAFDSANIADVDCYVNDYDLILGKAIKNCIPLPKGHGRISDMDAAIKCIEEVEGEDAIWAISLIEWACSKRTIIEADKAECERT